MGRFKVTNLPQDMAAFKTPTLRDITRSGPYFHNGSVDSLEQAVRQMAAGGLANPNLSDKIKENEVSDEQVADVLAAKGFDVDRRKISLDEEIRLTGIYPAKVKLHPEHTAEIKITVEPDMARAPVATPVAEQEPATQEETTTQEEPAEQEEQTAQEEPTA